MKLNKMVKQEDMVQEEVEFPSAGIVQTRKRHSSVFQNEIEDNSSLLNKQKLKNGNATDTILHSSNGKTEENPGSRRIFPKIESNSLPSNTEIKTPATFSKKSEVNFNKNADTIEDPPPEDVESDSGLSGLFQKVRRRSSAFFSEIKAFATSPYKLETKSETNSDISSHPACEANDGNPGILERIRRRSSHILFGKRTSETTSIKSEITYDEDIDILPFRLGYLTDAMIEKAKNVLNETEETRQMGINQLRELVNGETRLFYRDDDAFLLQFLRARKFDVEKAFTLMQNFFQFREEFSDIYENCDLTKIKKLAMANFLGILPTRDRFGSLVVIYKAEKWDPAIFSADDLFRAISIGLILAIDEPATQVNGFRVIFDSRGLGWKQIKGATPRHFRLLVKGTQSAFPGRFKAMHLFSDNILFNIGFKTLNPLLTNKIKQRLLHHGKDVKALQAYIHPSVLPTEYGGTAGPCDLSFFVDILNEKEEEVMKFLHH